MAEDLPKDRRRKAYRFKRLNESKQDKLKKKKKSKIRHIIIKLLKTKDKEEILKVPREKLLLSIGEHQLK